MFQLQHHFDTNPRDSEPLATKDVVGIVLGGVGVLAVTVTGYYGYRMYTAHKAARQRDPHRAELTTVYYPS